MLLEFTYRVYSLFDWKFKHIYQILFSCMLWNTTLQTIIQYTLLHISLEKFAQQCMPPEWLDRCHWLLLSSSVVTRLYSECSVLLKFVCSVYIKVLAGLVDNSACYQQTTWYLRAHWRVLIVYFSRLIWNRYIYIY